MMWDRKSLLQIFDFDYIWEVYKPAEQRKWGYYILPVFYGDRFVARVDSRLENGTWTISRWWWEPDFIPNADLLDVVENAIQHFLHYLRADRVCYAANVQTSWLSNAHQIRIAKGGEPCAGARGVLAPSSPPSRRRRQKGALENPATGIAKKVPFAK